MKTEPNKAVALVTATKGAELRLSVVTAVVQNGPTLKFEGDSTAWLYWTRRSDILLELSGAPSIHSCG